MIERHVSHTGSALGKRVLKDWEAYLRKFVKVMPTDYKRILHERAEEEEDEEPDMQKELVGVR